MLCGVHPSNKALAKPFLISIELKSSPTHYHAESEYILTCWPYWDILHSSQIKNFEMQLISETTK